MQLATAQDTYPQSLSVLSSTSVTSLQIQTIVLLLRELELNPDGRNKMNQIHTVNVDYRFLDPKHETTQVALTNAQL